MNWAYLFVGGLLLGAFLRTGYYTIRYEPEVEFGYAVTGLGIATSVLIGVYVDFARNLSPWYRAATLAGYLIVALGLVLINRERRQARS